MKYYPNCVHILFTFIPENSDLSELKSDVSNNYWRFYSTNSIPADSDLNDYKSYGNYHCNMNVTAQTLTHCPTTYAFNLKIFSATGNNNSDYIGQLLIDLNGAAYYRYYLGGTVDYWYGWKQFATLSDVNSLSDELVAYEHEQKMYRAYDSSSDK